MDARENMSRSKEVLGAYFRQGLHELGSAFYGPGTAAQHAEYGMLGTKTPGQVAEGLRGGAEPGREQDAPAPSGLEGHLEQARSRAAQEPAVERDNRDVERE